jgi:uracil phosphoribosyltransferase
MSSYGSVRVVAAYLRMSRWCGAESEAMRLANTDTSRMVANRLRELAEFLASQSVQDAACQKMMHAFLAVSIALETTENPPSRQQVLALVQVLTAGFEKLAATSVIWPSSGENDIT